MGRRPCCAKQGVNRGAWSVEEDAILAKYINTHGAGKWTNVAQKAGLKWTNVAQKAGLNRCGKSCRLRWLNYLRPDIKRGNFTDGEDELITRLHNLLGNKWALIAGRLPGRTDNEIKNYWNSVLSKKLEKPASHSQAPDQSCQNNTTPSSNQLPEPTPQPQRLHEVIRTKAVRFTKPVFFRVHHTNPNPNPSRVDHCNNNSHHPANKADQDIRSDEGAYGRDQTNEYGNTNLLLFGDTDDHHDDVDVGFNINDPSTKSVDISSNVLSSVDNQHHYDSDEMGEVMDLAQQLQTDSYYYNNNNEEYGDSLMQEIWRSIDDMLHDPNYCDN